MKTSKMDRKTSDPPTPLYVLNKYKELAKNPANHLEMIKDKTVINYLAYILDSSEEEVLKTSLDTLLLLSENQRSIQGIHSTFGVKEALNAILKNESIKDSEIKEKSRKVLEKLNIQSKKKKVLTLYVHGLHLETQKELEDVLMKKLKGIYSISVDVEHQKCIVTVYEHIDPKSIALVISENTGMEAKLISRNKKNQEILVPLIDTQENIDSNDLPPYLDEKDSPVKEKAVRSAKDFRITASEWFCTAAGFLQRTFY